MGCFGRLWHTFVQQNVQQREFCNSTACGFELIDATALRLGIPAQHAAALHQLKVKKLLAVLRTKLA
jgi:hypothetical protein